MKSQKLPILSRVLNRHPKFREAAERIWKKRLNKSAWKCPYPYSDDLVLYEVKPYVEAYGNLSKSEGFRSVAVGNPNVAMDETRESK